MSDHLPGSRSKGACLGPCIGTWALIVLFQFACATDTPRGTFLVGYGHKPLVPAPASMELVATTLASGLESASEELRAAGAQLDKVLGENVARVMTLAVASLSGHPLGQVLSLPGFHLAGAQGGAAVMGRLEGTEGALTSEGAVVAAESVATSPQAPMAMVMLTKGPGPGEEMAPGGRSGATVIRHRGGNRQVELSDAQRWHLPRGTSAADTSTEDKVGDMLQEAITKSAREWGPHRLSGAEKRAIADASKNEE